MNFTFSIGFDDLTFEKQEGIIDRVYASLIKEYERQGHQLMTKKWYVTPKTWQEAYCREYGLSKDLWGDLDENSKEFQEIEWPLILEENGEDEARETLFRNCDLSLEFEI